MTEVADIDVSPPTRPPMTATELRLRARYRSEARFRVYGMAAIAIALLFLAFLLVDILSKGLPAFVTHRLALDVAVPANLAGAGIPAEAAIRGADWRKVLQDSVRALFPDVTERKAKKRLVQLVSSGAEDQLRERALADPSIIGTTVQVPVLLSDRIDSYLKGSTGRVDRISGSSPLSIVVEGDGIRMQATPEIAGAFAGKQALDENSHSLLVVAGESVVKLTELEGTVAKGVALGSVSASASVAGAWAIMTIATPESRRDVTDLEIAWIEKLSAKDRIDRGFNWRFLTSGDSREPEDAGIRGALIGSLLTMLVTLALCLPIGVAAAVYLEEFAPKNRLTDLIEVNINNLAAVPSIVFGLLGLAVFLNFFGLPRSAPIVGGLVLSLLVLPTIIIASRSALGAVPPSIREAALGVGASQQQAVFHHVLPLALPGILTGAILGIARSLGETAPLLMIGMVAFIIEVPTGFTSPATVLPVQIYLWSDLPEAAFQSKTAAAIIVLLAVLLAMNAVAIYLRRKFERKW